MECNESELILSQFSDIDGKNEFLDFNKTDCEVVEDLNEQEENLEIIKVINDDNQEDMEIQLFFDKDKNGDFDEIEITDSSDEKFTIDHVASLNTNNYYSLEKCKFCNMELEIEQVKKHQMQFGHYDESETIMCPHCNISTRNVTSMKQHLRSCHSNRRESKKYVCDICSKGLFFNPIV